MAEEKTVKVLIVCAIGMSSSLLESKTAEAAKEYGIILETSSINTPEVGRYDFKGNYVDMVLIAPQVRYKRKSITEMAGPHGTVVENIDPVTYGMVDGVKLFEQIKRALEL
jgi:PTS system cellobiose-specific IIB component